MLITCPKCSTKYNLSDSVARPLSRARCKFCEHVFILADGMEKEAFDVVSENMTEQEAAAREAVEAIVGEDLSYDVDGDKKVKVKGKISFKKLIIAAAIFIFLAGGGAAAYFKLLSSPKGPDHIAALFQNETKEKEAEGKEGKGSEESATGEETGEEKGKEKHEGTSQNQTATPPLAAQEFEKLTLDNPNQFFMRNEKAGQLFVIRGEVLNRYTTPKELIRAKAELLDASDNVLLSKEFFCGATVTMFQLQVLSLGDLEKALTDKVAILTNNTDIKPGSSVPFMVVFANVPNSVRKFKVSVIGAKDPAPSN